MVKVRYSFSSRRTGRLENIRKQKAKYPLLAEKVIRMSDIILEILDSRFIRETRNPEMEKLIRKEEKKIIYVFNKSDLIDIKKVSEKDRELSPKSFVSCTERRGIKELRNKIKSLSSQIENPVDKEGKRVTVGVIGYPNTGKSSVINLLTGKGSAGIGADAGYTKAIQKVKLTHGIVLLDSPGVIPKKEYSTSDNETWTKNTKVGARSYGQVKNPGVVVSDLMKEYPGVFEKFYNISAEGDSEALMEELGRKKGFLNKGNKVDEDKTARYIIKNWQEGKIKIDSDKA
jgi:ribosome biogenesis GTPase A